MKMVSIHIHELHPQGQSDFLVKNGFAPGPTDTIYFNKLWFNIDKMRRSRIQPNRARPNNAVHGMSNNLVGRRHIFILFAGVFLILSAIACCSPLPEQLAAVDFTPQPGDDWPVSTPEEQGIDPMLLAELYYYAAELETLYGLLIIKNGYLIAEGYFNAGAIDQLSGRQSAMKIFTSALVGIAIDQGYLSGIDERMIDFFPEMANQITDQRKNQITIEHLLQMRAGYPDEETTPSYLDLLFFVENWHWIPHISDFPLVSDPGSEFNYSNLNSHLLGIIVARETGKDLMTYAQENLLSPINAEVGDWTADADNYKWGWGEIYITARNMAKFGMLYLNNGKYGEDQAISADWVQASLYRHSENVKISGQLISKYGTFREIGYGYQWWSATVGKHEFDYACGHGGQYIILLDELDMNIVTTADPLYSPDLAGAGGWQYEGPINNVVRKSIRSLPTAP